MKKKSSLYNSEINLADLFKIFWDGKINIILITIISFSIGFAYNSRLVDNYVNSVTIRSSDNVEFLKLNYIYQSLNIEKKTTFTEESFDNSVQINDLIFNQFIKELSDYNEFVFYFKNIKKISNEQKLYQYSKLLGIDGPNDNFEATLNFRWNDASEARYILENVLKLTSTNLEKKIFKEIDDIFIIKQKLILNEDAERIEYLEEQSTIAKELGISKLLKYTNDDAKIIPPPAYYILGYKAIDNEIDVIKNRSHIKIINLKNDIEVLKKASIKWIDYNINLITKKTLKKNNISSIKTIFLGLFFGILLVLIVHLFKSQILPKKGG